MILRIFKTILLILKVFSQKLNLRIFYRILNKWKNVLQKILFYIWVKNLNWTILLIIIIITTTTNSSKKIFSIWSETPFLTKYKIGIISKLIIILKLLSNFIINNKFLKMLIYNFNQLNKIKKNKFQNKKREWNKFLMILHRN